MDNDGVGKRVVISTDVRRNRLGHRNVPSRVPRCKFRKLYPSRPVFLKHHLPKGVRGGVCDLENHVSAAPYKPLAHLGLRRIQEAGLL
jgi:hypothetical protein